MQKMLSSLYIISLDSALFPPYTQAFYSVWRPTHGRLLPAPEAEQMLTYPEMHNPCQSEEPQCFQGPCTANSECNAWHWTHKMNVLDCPWHETSHPPGQNSSSGLSLCPDPHPRPCLGSLDQRELGHARHRLGTHAGEPALSHTIK